MEWNVCINNKWVNALKYFLTRVSISAIWNSCSYINCHHYRVTIKQLSELIFEIFKLEDSSGVPSSFSVYRQSLFVTPSLLKTAPSANAAFVSSADCALVSRHVRWRYYLNRFSDLVLDDQVHRWINDISCLLNNFFSDCTLCRLFDIIPKNQRFPLQKAFVPRTIECSSIGWPRTLLFIFDRYDVVCIMKCHP